MAVTVADLKQALRIPETQTDDDAQLTRLLSAAKLLVERVAPGAPTDVKDEAVIRYASYVFDADTDASPRVLGQAWRNSGAEGLLRLWVKRRALVAGSSR